MPSTPNGPVQALANGTGGYQLGVGSTSEPNMSRQAAPAAYTTAVTMTPADLISNIIIYTGAGAGLTMPLASDMDAALPNAGINSAFDLTVLSNGAGSATVTTNTGWTLVGAMVVAAGIAFRFRARRTAPAAWTLYQLA